MMTKQEFYAELDNVLELRPGTIQGKENLAEMESWDSLAMLSFLAMADSKLDTSVPGEVLEKCRTVGDLLALFPAEKLQEA